ncbi:MAG: MFS transporter [Chloroflexi bacterium]|nr:MFS transporter [Chloroflexota bacterium]
MYVRSTSNRLLALLFITQSLSSAAQIAVFTLAAIVTVRLSGTESTAGLPSSVLTFSQALLALPFAMLMGRFGRRLGLTLGYAAGALAGLVGLMAIVQGTFPLLMVSAALMGMSRASGEQSRFAAGELFPEAERARMIGRLVFAGTIGAVVGPVLVVPGGQLMSALGLHPDTGPWAVMLLLCSLAALLTFWALRPDPMAVGRTIAGHVETNRQDRPAAPVRPLRTLLLLPKVQLAVAAALVSQTVMVVLMVMTPLHMDHHHHGREAISLVISMHTLGMFGLSAVTGYLIDRFGRVPMLVAGALILIVSALLAPVSTNQYILSAALFLLGLGWNFGYVAASSLLADTLQGEERARVQGVNDSLVFLAAGFGSLASGPLFASGGYAAVSSAGIVLTLALIGLIVWLNRPQLKAKPI